MELTFWPLTCLVLIPAILYASWIDYKEKRVPNWLNAAIAVAGFAAQGAFFGWTGVMTGLWGLLVGFGVLIGFWLMHAMGTRTRLVAVFSAVFLLAFVLLFSDLIAIIPIPSMAAVIMVMRPP